MKRRSVTVHQNHRRGKVETARRQDPYGRLRVEGLAGDHPRRVEVVAAPGEDQDGEQSDRKDPRHADDCDATLEKGKVLRCYFSGCKRFIFQPMRGHMSGNTVMRKVINFCFKIAFRRGEKK